MKSLSDYTGKDLRLVRPSALKRGCRLVSGESVLMSAAFPVWHKSEAVVEGFDKKWEFRKPSIWKSEIGVYDTDKNYPFATYTGSAFSSEGFVVLPRGARLRLEARVFKGIYKLFTDMNDELITITQKGFFKRTTTVVFGKRKDLIDEYPWLVLLMWYVLQQNQNHSIAI